MCRVTPQHSIFALHFGNPLSSLWIVTLVSACSTYKSCRSLTWAVPLQQSRLGPRWRCIQCWSPGSSARCGRCCLILGSAGTRNGVHSKVVRLQRGKRVFWHVFFEAWGLMVKLPWASLLQPLGRRRPCTDARCLQQPPTGHSRSWWWGQWLGGS